MKIPKWATRSCNSKMDRKLNGLMQKEKQ